MDEGGASEFASVTQVKAGTDAVSEGAATLDADAGQLDLFGMPVGMPASSSAPPQAAPDGVSGTTRQRQARTSLAASLWEEETEADEADADANPGPKRNPRRTRRGALVYATAPKKRRTRDVIAAEPSSDVLEIAAGLPPQIRLGTSTWSFPGWKGIVYGDDYSNSKLSRDGLTAYGPASAAAHGEHRPLVLCAAYRHRLNFY